MKVRYCVSHEKLMVIPQPGSVVMLFEPHEQKVALHAFEAILNKCDEEMGAQFLSIIELISKEGDIT